MDEAIQTDAQYTNERDSFLLGCSRGTRRWQHAQIVAKRRNNNKKLLRLDFLPESIDQDASALLERTRLFYLSISASCPPDL